MPEGGPQAWHTVSPRRWTAVAAALLLVGGLVTEFALLRSRCPGRLLSWGLCNRCGEMTRNKIRYELGRGGSVADRYFCPGCVEKAPEKIVVVERGSARDRSGSVNEDWSLGLRFGIQAVVLSVLALYIVLARHMVERQVPLTREVADFLPGPILVVAMLATSPGSWFPPIAAAGAWLALVLKTKI